MTDHLYYKQLLFDLNPPQWELDHEDWLNNMKLVTIKDTEHRLADAWYIKYPLDAYALGPLRFDLPVSAVVAIEQAVESFGERPRELWPHGHIIEVDEYEIELDVPECDVD